jgi:hypothetical protein
MRWRMRRRSWVKSVWVRVRAFEIVSLKVVLED